MSLDIESLKAKFQAEEDEKNKREKGGNNTDWYRFFDMDYDETALVRFLPDADPAADHFVIEKFLHKLDVEHEGKTQKRFVPCLTMYGDECPICKAAKAFYDDDDEKNGSRFYKKKSYVAQVLIQKSPIEYEGGDHKLINLEPKIYEVIKKAIVMGDLEKTPTDYERGTDFRLNKTKDGKWDSFVTSSFARKETALDMDRLKDVELKVLKDNLPRKPSLEYVNTVLNAALTGEPFVWDNKKSNDSETKSLEAKTPVAKKAKSEPAKMAKEAVDESDEPTSEPVEATTKPKTKKNVLDIIAKRKNKETAGD